MVADNLRDAVALGDDWYTAEPSLKRLLPEAVPAAERLADTDVTEPGGNGEARR